METRAGTIWGRESAMVLALVLVQAVIALVVAFRLQLAPDQIGAILTVTAVVLTAHHPQPGEPGVTLTR